VTKITHADNRYKSFKYDQWGNKRTEWNELGERTDYVYDSYNRVTSATRTMTPAANEVTAYTYKPTNGGGGSPYLHTTNNPDSITAPTGIMTSNVYDENFRKTSTAVGAAITQFAYDNVGDLRFVMDPNGHATETDYDTRNRKWHVWDAQRHQTTFTYDNASNVIDILRPDTTHETKTYDALNRVLTDTVPKDNSTIITTTFNYNPSGTINWVKDGKNQQTTFEYNASDQRTTMTYPDGSFQSWAYDDAHNMKSRTTVHGETKYFAYDNRNRKYGEAWENLSGEWALYLPDAANRLRRAVNGGWQDGQPTTICDVHRDYDHAGRLTLDKQDIDGENNGLGPLEVHYEYNPTLGGTDGKPTHMYVGPGPGYDYDYSYDEMGRFEKILVHNAGNPWFQYHYDNASNETRRDNLLNHVNQIYDPDELNRTSKVELQYNSSSFWLESYDYYLIGRLHTATRGNRQDQFNYYLDGELHAVFYDAMVAEAPDPNEIPPAEDLTKEKTVDDFLGLPDGTGPGAPQTVAHTVTYHLDNAGNRTGVTDSLSGTTSYNPNNLNQYINNIGADAISNGVEHEIGSYKNFSYTYMKDEHLIRVTSVANTYDLAYDALGRCVKRTLRIPMEGPQSSPRPTPPPRPPPTPHPRPSPPPPSPTPPPGFAEMTKYYIYDGERPILEYDANGELAGYNLYGKGVDEILLRNDPTLQAPQTFYYQQDHEGSITFLTYLPPTGVSPILEYYRYDVFGKPAIYGPPPNWSLRSASLFSNRFLFTGREYNAMFGFYEYRARAYHPDLGRFMSEDPKLFDAGDYNLFRYCHNDPLDLTDPMGLDAEPNGDGTYHYVLRTDIVVHDIVGRYVVDSHGNMKQCAGAAQFLTGTRTVDGKLHDAPQAKNGGWHQGAPLTKKTPDGTMVARGWKNGLYPNESPQEAEKNGSKILNHTGIKVGWDDKNNRAIILDQWKSESGSLQKRSYDPKEGDWSVVNANKRYDSQPSRSDFNLDQAVQKSNQEAAEKVGEAETGQNRQSQ
jgi:RHS repeat-associated protein